MKEKSPRGGRNLQDRFSSVGKFVLLLGILVAVFVFAAILGMRLTIRGTEVTVPDVVGRPAAEAREILRQADLELAVSGERFDPQVPQGSVVSQLPSSGLKIKSNRVVQVIVSLGKRTTPVPDLVGSTVRVARLSLMQNGFELGNLSYVNLPDYPDGEVIEQFPEAESVDSVASRIDLLINDRSESRFVMPNVNGSNITRAMLFFERNGFKVTAIQYRDAGGITLGTIVKQFPEPGYPLTRSMSINLEVVR